MTDWSGGSEELVAAIYKNPTIFLIFVPPLVDCWVNCCAELGFPAMGSTSNLKRHKQRKTKFIEPPGWFQYWLWDYIDKQLSFFVVVEFIAWKQESKEILTDTIFIFRNLSNNAISSISSETLQHLIHLQVL